MGQGLGDPGLLLSASGEQPNLRDPVPTWTPTHEPEAGWLEPGVGPKVPGSAPGPALCWEPHTGL